jgi:hypothetical protein
MRIRIRWALGLGLAAVALVAGIAWAQNVANYNEQGGARTVIGGSLDVISGGDLDIESGGAIKIAGTAITSTAAEVNTLDGVSATAAEHDEYVLNAVIDDISTAGSYWVVAPHAGSISKIYTVIDTAITVADAAITFEIGGTAVTNGAITIAYSGSAAGTVDSSTPTALNVLTAGQALELITDGGSTDASKAEVAIVISR